MSVRLPILTISSLAIFLTISLLFLPEKISADYNQAYNDYIFNYQSYRDKTNAFQVAKSTYQTYKTLSAQNDALIAFQNLLKSRNQLVGVYYDLLWEKMNATDGVAPDTISTFASIRTSEKSWLTANQAKIDAAATFSDLNSVSGEFDSRYPQIQTETRQAIGRILIAKEAVLRLQVDAASSSLSGQLARLATLGEDTSLWDREIISSQNKLELQSQKMAEVNTVFFSPGAGDVSIISTGQQKLMEANQYLRETANFLTEIVKSITGTT